MANTAAFRPAAAAGTLAATGRTSAPAVPADRLRAVLGAFNAANLASGYIERGNFAAARRKLVLALAAVNELQADADVCTASVGRG